ncbi:MAG: CDP-alcohol phosphatidyltransferase family protein [Thiotrichales bacterium]
MNAIPTLKPSALHRSAAGHAAMAVGVLVLGASAFAWVLDLSDAYPLKSFAVLLIALALLAPLLRQHQPQTAVGWANRVTLLRLVLTALLAGLLGESVADSGWWVVALALTVVTLDGVDGWLARRFQTESAFGARFDMETDALLILVLAALAWALGKAGVWILLAGGLRYAFVAAGYHLAWMRRELPCSQRRKAACVVQIATLIACVAPVLQTPWSAWVGGGGLIFLCYSFWIDVRWLRRHARAAED